MSSGLPPGTRLGRYEIRSPLGAGGMGEVYLAYDAKLDRKVALKILPAEVATHPDRMARFVQEAKAASALNHPNIITIYEIEKIGSVNLIATEFIDGETLRERIKNTSHKLIDILDIVVQIAGALSAAHAAGIVHRDLKPENIMLRYDGIVKVVDFGLAKLTEPLTNEAIDTTAPTRAILKTEPGVVLGTAVYMSPEQSRGLAVDSRTDIFSFGVLIYEMVTGRLPYEGSNSNEIVASILSDREPEPLARYTRDVPAELERIVWKALRKSRDERYQTSKDLFLDLRNLKQNLEFHKKLDRSSHSQTRHVEAFETDAETATHLRSVARAKGTNHGYSTFTRKNIFIVLGGLFVAATAIGVYLYFHPAFNGAINSVAILPFDNVGSDPNTEYLSDGITESLINQLSQLPQLKVIARSSSFKYKAKEFDPEAVANALGVRAVVTGRVVRRGDELIISVELMDARDRTQVWGDQYDRKVSDLFSVQREIVTKITQSLRLKLSGAAQSQISKASGVNPESYELYLKGRYSLNSLKTQGIKESLNYFQGAIEKDSKNGPAYAGLAESYSLLSLGGATSFIAPKEGIAKAKEAALKAVEIDDTLAEAHTSLGLIALSFEWDWSSAEKEFKRAIGLNPNYVNAHHWYSHYFIAMGRFDDSLAESQRALALDPLDVAMNFHLGFHYFIARQYDQAIAQLQKTLEMDQTSAESHGLLGSCYEQKEKFDAAVTELEKSMELGGDDTRGSLGHVFAMSGRRSAAEKLLSHLQEEATQKFVSPYMIAVIYAGLGEKDEAFAFLEKAYTTRDSNIVNIKVDPELNTLHSDPRFSGLLRRMGLPT